MAQPKGLRPHLSLSLKHTRVALGAVAIAWAAVGFGQAKSGESVLRAEIERIERRYEIRLFFSEGDLRRATIAPFPSGEPADLAASLRRLETYTTLAVDLAPGDNFVLRHDPSAVGQVRALAKAARAAREVEIGAAEVNAAIVEGTDAEALPTDVLLLEDEPLYRAFDRIGERYGVYVLYHPEDVPSYPAKLRQRGSGIETLRAAVGGTDLRYVRVGRDSFVVGPSARLERAYATEVLKGWRAGRYRSPDDAVAEVLRFTIGTDADAQVTTARVEGTVFDEASGEPLIGVGVRHSASGVGTATDFDGSFELMLPKGTQTLQLQSIGYVPQPLELEVIGDGVLPPVTMAEGVSELRAVVVSARGQRTRLREAAGGLTALSTRRLNLLPVFTGEPDVLLALTRSAGVAASSEGSVAVSVRGGALDANSVLQGGIPVLYPAHALGFFPVFHPDLVKGVTLHRGYVPPVFGGRAASVIDVEWRTGDFHDWHLRGGTGLLSSRLSVSGPLARDKLSFIAGARGSHLNWILQSQNRRDINASIVGFADASAGLTGRWATGRVELRGFAATDDFRYGQRFGFAYRNRGARVAFRQQLPSAINLRASATVSAFGSERRGIIELPGPFKFTSGLIQETIQASLSRKLSRSLRAELGAEVNRYLTADREQIADDGSAAEDYRFADPDLDAVAAYASVSFGPDGPWSFEGGLRLLAARSARAPGPVSEYAGAPTQDNLLRLLESPTATRFHHKPVLQPRLRATYQPEDAPVVIGVTYARLAQPVSQLSPTVSPTPGDIFFVASEFLPITTSQLVGATLASVGSPSRLRRLGFEFGAYYRSLRNAHSALGGQLLRASATPERDVYTADGFAAGAELTLRYGGVHTQLEVAYAYGRSFLAVDREYEALRAEPNDLIPSATDLPHQFSLTYSYRPTGRFTTGIGFTLTSGRPFTGIEALIPQNGSIIPTYARVNRQRLPLTHRLDLSAALDNSRARERGLRVGFGLSVYNLYGRENPFAVFYEDEANRLRAFQFAFVGEAIPAVTLNFQWD